MNKETYQMFKQILTRIYNLESALKTIDYTQHEESNSKIDYLAMMADIELDEDEDEEKPFGESVEDSGAENVEEA